MADAHKNFAISTVATAPSPATSGTSLVVAAGHGTRFPAVPFNATICSTSVTPDPSTAEVVRVTAISTDTLTITRAQESTTARTVLVGDTIYAGVTATTLEDVEDLTNAFGLSEVSVTGAVTATIGKMHYCTGTSADYTVALPAASGNSGRYIGFRMGPIASLTKMVTLDGDSSELIDGATTRIMIADEVAILRCDGTGWAKVAGKSLPIRIKAEDGSSDQNLSTNTVLTLDLVTTIEDLYGSVSLASNSITIKRPGRYILCAAAFFYSFSADTSECDVGVRYNGSDNWQRDRRFIKYLGVTYATQCYPKLTVPVSVLAGDVLIPTLFSGASVASTLASVGVHSFIELLELPSW